jgi:hypothetical protein
VFDTITQAITERTAASHAGIFANRASTGVDAAAYRVVEGVWVVPPIWISPSTIYRLTSATDWTPHRQQIETRMGPTQVSLLVCRTKGRINIRALAALQLGFGLDTTPRILPEKDHCCALVGPDRTR